MSDHPVFAVVGRVNKGKSSIIATLAEDPQIEMSAVPGTTRRSQGYPVLVDGETLFELVDTPGFEDAPGALAWMRQSKPSAAEYGQRVRDFIEAFEGTDEFVEERELLAPIIDGAAILYVVDGTKPYRKNYQDEMEILQWTGRPSMALINMIGEADHSEDWFNALNHYFKVVRIFDAHAARFTDRIELLRPFRALFPNWRERLDQLITALEQDRADRRNRAASTISALLQDALTFTLETRVENETQLQRERERLEESFHDGLRDLEHKARARVESLYKHRLEWSGPQLDRPVLEQDLFAERTWELFGLSPGRLLALYTISGATVGGLIDAGIGGISFGAGALLGAWWAIPVAVALPVIAARATPKRP